MKHEFYAGFSERDISPPPGLRLAGYPHVLRKNTGIHDPLYASAAIFSGGGQCFALLSLDLLWLSKPETHRMRKEISRASGIPPGHIMICVTHTHSAHIPASFGDYAPKEIEAGPQERDFAILRRAAAKAVVKAMESRFAAELGWHYVSSGRGQEIGGNRRDPIHGPSDDRLLTVGLREKSGRLRGVINRYCLHPTALHEDNTLVSADWPGEMRAALREQYGEIAVLFLQGTSGDQSNRYFRRAEEFTESAGIGRILSSAASENLKKMQWQSSLTLNTGRMESDLILRALPTEEQAKADLAAAKANCEKNTHENKRRTLQVNLFGAEETLSYVRRMARPESRKRLLTELPCELQAFALGDLAILGIQGELFVEYGLAIEKASPFACTMVAGLCNGGLPGYLFTRQAGEQGGYEVGSSLLDPKSGDYITAAAQKLLKQVYNLSRKGG